MYIYLYNPHNNHSYAKTIQRLIFRHPQFSKLNYVLRSLKKQDTALSLIDGEVFPESSKYWPHGMLWSKLEYYLWSKVNNIKIKASLIKSVQIDDSDILILTAKDLKYKKIYDLVESSECKIILLTNHFFNSYDSNCMFLNRYHHRVSLVSEASIVDNPVLGIGLDYDMNEYQVGWAVSSRFSSYADFSRRKKRCASLGSITIRKFGGFINKILRSYNEITIHPSRYYIYKNQDKFNYVDVFSECRDYASSARVLSLTTINSLFFKIVIMFRNKLVTTKYYSVNMVDLMNSYQFIIYGHDIFEQPSLGVYEAMSCGCVVIGTDSYAYRSIGLTHNYNYISVPKNSDVASIDDVIQEYLNNNDLLLSIRDRSIAFAKQHTEASVCMKFDEILHKEIGRC
jgi:glycosyltransferase involved in cell wall biosynthesis